MTIKEKQAKLHSLLKNLKVAIFIVFGVSLAAPICFTSEDFHPTGQGLTALLFGWVGALSHGGFYLSWFANPFIFVSFFLIKNQPLPSLILSSIGFLLTLLFLQGGEYLLNEAGHTAYISGFHLGYFAWVATSILIIASSLISLKIKKGHPMDDLS